MLRPRDPGRPGPGPSTGIEPVLSFVGLDDISADNSALGLASGPPGVLDAAIEINPRWPPGSHWATPHRGGGQLPLGAGPGVEPLPRPG